MWVNGSELGWYFTFTRIILGQYNSHTFLFLSSQPTRPVGVFLRTHPGGVHVWMGVYLWVCPHGICVWTAELQKRSGGICLWTCPGGVYVRTGVCVQTFPSGVCLKTAWLWIHPAGVYVWVGNCFCMCPERRLSPDISERCLSPNSLVLDTSGWILCPGGVYVRVVFNVLHPCK